MLAGTDALKVERSLLKDQVADLLHDRILTGDLQQGTKVVERELAELLGVSRVPVRDALMQLEAEGLVVSRPSGRYVIELTKRDVRELYQIRVVLEKLAVSLVIEKNSPEDCEVLVERLEDMRRAVVQQDTPAYVRCDVEIHRQIWDLSDNHHLKRIFDSMIGPIFIFISDHARVYDWGVTLSLHEDLVSSILAGDVEAAYESVERHMADALGRSLKLLDQKSPAKTS